MSATSPAALRELAQTLTVPESLHNAGTGVIAAAKMPDGREGSWFAGLTCWVPVWAWEEGTTDDLLRQGARITHVPVPVDQLAAVRAALEGAAAELETIRALDPGLTIAVLRAALSTTLSHLPADHRAEMERILTAPGNAGPPPKEVIEARVDLDRLRTGLNRLRKTSCGECDAAEVAYNLLAETEGGESRG